MDAWTDVDADVVVAEGVETRTRTRACDDAGDAADGEGDATLTRTRLGADARRTTAKPRMSMTSGGPLGVASEWRSSAAAVLFLLGTS